MKNSVTIALNVLYAKKEKIYPPYVSKHNSDREKQAILLTIPNGEGWHYFAVKETISIINSLLNEVPQVSKCPSVLSAPECLSVLSAQVSKCLSAPSAPSAQVPKCLSALYVRVPKCLKCPSAQAVSECTLSTLGVS